MPTVMALPPVKTAMTTMDPPTLPLPSAALPTTHRVVVANSSLTASGPTFPSLSLMLGFGIVSRIASGWLADRVGGAMTLLIGSTLQCLALVFYLISDSLVSLYISSALFGLFQGGIVPSYAIIIREYFPAREAASRVGLTVSSTIVGMALGGWMGGVLFDMTGSYRAAFINGIAWNVLNAAIAWWLLSRQMRQPHPSGPAAA